MLSEVYRRLAACAPAWRMRLLSGPQAAPGRGWVSADGFAARIDELVAGEAARILADHGRAVPAHVAASRLLHHYLWSACLLAGGPWYLADLVPELHPDQVWLHPASGDLACRPGRCQTSGAPDRLRSVVGEFAEPTVAAFQPVSRRGARALWGMVADDLVSGIWYLGRMLDREEHAVARAAALLPGGTTPLRGPAGFRRLPAGELTRTRAGCCMYYAIRPAEACLTCPRVCDAERARRLTA
ncbi:(2Fe-2S)-binding protein [Kitasatospora sp. RB6PN24]|uniref:(2Fe-2S)-binding protein n=1 Tax=Kitasatospora humi TaxID=2893891 RepID=UPI001E39871B|nr:(2Fe-2S)-binding protein [Kitasatospora humi]MCC9310657.1 (2Fe-2S)-binding protein [Kitasatospora humi]